MDLTNKTLQLETKDGQWKTLRPLSLLSAHRLSAMYGLIVDRLKVLGEDLTISEALAQDSLFVHLCNECLELCGLNIDEVSVPMLERLIFPYDDRQVGDLIAFNFPDIADKNQKQIGKAKDAIASLLASIWLTTEDLGKSIEALELLTSTDLELVLKERSELMKPAEQKAKETSYNNAMDIINKRGLIDG